MSKKCLKLHLVGEIVFQMIQHPNCLSNVLIINFNIDYKDLEETFNN